MSAGSPGGLFLVALLILLGGLLAPSEVAGRPSEVSQAAPQVQATVQPGAGRAGQSPALLGDINNDGIVDIRDYGIWRQNFGQTNCGNVADLDGNCLVDIRDYGIWRQNFGQTGPTLTPTSNATVTPPSTASPTATPTLSGRAYVTSQTNNTVSVIDTTTNTVVGVPIPVGIQPLGVGVDPTVHRAYVVNLGSNTVSVIDTTTNTVVGGPITVGTLPG